MLNRLAFFAVLLIIATSCYNSRITNNYFGRKELKTKRYPKQFKEGMDAKIDTKSIYYRYYEDSLINYKQYAYLRFLSNGKYAYFISTTDSIIDINNLNIASHVGYYITKNNIIKLETPTGNFNTPSYRIIWEFSISDDGKLIEKGGLKRIYHKAHNISLKYVNPDW